MAKVVPNPFYPDFSVTVALVTNINDATDLRKGVMSGKFEATLLNPSLILDEFQIIAAANQAIHLFQQKKMVTKTVHSEILYRLSPTKNISESFKKFGVADGAKSVCVLIVNDHNGTVLKEILDISQGTLETLDQLSEMADINLIKKIYKLSEDEIASDSFVDAIVSRIASKDIVTV